MGEANGNPLSRQYKGEKPDALLGGGVRVQVLPNAAWMERAKLAHDAAVAAGEAPLPMAMTDADRDVVFDLQLHWTIPMVTAEKHPRVTVPIPGEVRVPLLAVKRSVRDVLVANGENGLAAMMKLEDDGQADS